MQRRVLVIGLDGGTFDLIEPWAAAGHLPNLARLMSEGCRGYLRSTLQPITASAWATFMTGVNQGKHGLYDFVRRRAGEYDLEVTNGTHILAPTMFDVLSQAGQHVLAINIPYTFPPRPVNGIMVGGPFAPAVTSDMVYPRSFFDRLSYVVPGYFVLPDYDAQSSDPLMGYADQLLRGVELRERLSLHLVETEPWDLCTVVFMATDEAQHAYWSFMEADPGSPGARYQHIIRRVYERVDQAIGALLAEIDRQRAHQETIVMIVSDHGAGPFRWMINLNRWLAQAGYLTFRADRANSLGVLKSAAIKSLARTYRRYVPPRIRKAVRTQLGGQRFERVKGDLESALLTRSIDWDKTRAYALGAGGNIFVNLRGREPSGTVQPGADYERLCQEIADRLHTLSDPETEAPVIDRVYRREELYAGPFLEQAPDLVIQWRDYTCWGRGRYDSQGGPVFESQRYLDFSQVPLSGTHRLEGIFVAHGSGIRTGAKIEGARIADIAPTILGILGVPAPEDIDGRALGECFLEDVLDDVPAVAQTLGATAAKDDAVYTSEEEVELSRRLRDLGYL